MRILLIACSYPPDPVVGSFRAAKLARAFLRAGCEVDVVTSRLPGETRSLREEEPGLRVHAVRELGGPRALYRAVKDRFFGGPTTAGESPVARSAEPRAGRRRLPFWKRYPLSFLWVPDDRQGFVPAAVARSLPIVRRGIDLVYTTAPPFSDHLVGLALQRFTGVPWVAEFRDPWTENRSKREDLRTRPADALNRMLERSCIARADLLVAVSEGIRDLLVSKVPAARRERVFLALNGIDNLGMPADAELVDGDAYRIVHTGSFYAGRDPRPFLTALAGIVARLRLTPAEVRVEFIGNSRTYQGESLESFVSTLGLAGFVEFHDWMPQEEARARAAGADLLFLPFPRHGRLIPNKLYDYLGLRRPILAFVDPAGEAARMLRRLPGHYLVTDPDAATAEHALEQALRARSRLVYGPDEERLLRSWSTGQQLDGLVKTLQEEFAPAAELAQKMLPAGAVRPPREHELER